MVLVGKLRLVNEGNGRVTQRQAPQHRYKTHYDFTRRGIFLAQGVAKIVVCITLLISSASLSANN